MPNLKIGDVVKLRSGGPRMTITGEATEYANGQTMVECTWFDGSKKVTDVFPPQVLEVLNEDEQKIQFVEDTSNDVMPELGINLSGFEGDQ